MPEGETYGGSRTSSGNPIHNPAVINEAIALDCHPVYTYLRVSYSEVSGTYFLENMQQIELLVHLSFSQQEKESSLPKMIVGFPS